MLPDVESVAAFIGIGADVLEVMPNRVFGQRLGLATTHRLSPPARREDELTRFKEHLRVDIDSRQYDAPVRKGTGEKGDGD
jgi:hypothetical protein